MNLWLALGGIMQQAAPTPDTLTFMVAGYIVFWAVALVYLISLSSRERNVERDLEALQQLMEEEQKEPQAAGRKDAAMPDVSERVTPRQ